MAERAQHDEWPLIGLSDIPCKYIRSCPTTQEGFHEVQTAIDPKTQKNSYSYSSLKAQLEPFMALAHRSPKMQTIFAKTIEELEGTKKIFFHK
jgi:hypothetical protein